MINRQAFTKNEQGIVLSLISECGVSLAHPPPDSIEYPITFFAGLWDTGATGTVISKRVIDTLNLRPISKCKVFHAGGESIVNVYAINLHLPNHVAFQFIKVTEGNLNGFDVLIGMDVMSQGDFSLSNFQGKTTFSFRIPSLKETDFTKENPNTPPHKKVQRNDTCPCGSGKKYKQCHGKNE